MKLVFAIFLILFGSFLIGVTIDNLGHIGNIIMNLSGAGCYAGAIFLVRSKKGKQTSS